MRSTCNGKKQTAQTNHSILANLHGNVALTNQHKNIQRRTLQNVGGENAQAPHLLLADQSTNPANCNVPNFAPSDSSITLPIERSTSYEATPATSETTHSPWWEMQSRSHIIPPGKWLKLSLKSILKKFIEKCVGSFGLKRIYLRKLSFKPAWQATGTAETALPIGIEEVLTVLQRQGESPKNMGIDANSS